MKANFLAGVTAALGLFWSGVSGSAEIKILSIPGVKAAVDQLIPEFEKASGHNVVIEYQIYPVLRPQVEAGAFDVAIFARQQIDVLAAQQKVLPETVADVARTSIGVAVKKGAPKPPLRTVEEFKQALLRAKSVTYTRESATGTYISALLARLGIADQLKDKLILQPGGDMTTPAVAAGNAELGIVLVSDIVRNAGADLAGQLPSEIQNYVVQAAAVGTSSGNRKAASDFITFLKQPKSGQVFTSTGLEPLSK
jgi:molybdate transport system substrate-binding protein